MIKNDVWIRRMVKEYRMIEPFEANQVRDGVISYGLSSFGYDARIANEYHIARGMPDVPLDPKNANPDIFEEVLSQHVIIPSHTFVLARTVEYFRIPRRVMGLCVGKSTYARSGIVINVTPLEPEWEGYVTMAISNTTGRAVKLYGNEGVMQVLFFESDEAPEISYKDRKGKYQAQQNITPSKL